MHTSITSDRQREYLIHRHLPPGQPPPRGFPVVWLLDSPTTWAPMQQAIRQSGGDAVAVVGIGWEVEGGVDPNLRRRDFTRPALHEVPPPRGSAAAWTEDGDADAFLDFLTGTVQPRLLDELPLDRTRQTLAGHSLSGHLVLHALMARPRAFQRFVAASPSIWWDGARLLDEAKQADWSRARAARVLVTVGSQEQSVGPEKPPEVDGEDAAALLGEPHMVDHASAFAALLRGRGVDCDFRLFEGEGHKTVLPAAMAAALAFARR